MGKAKRIRAERAQKRDMVRSELAKPDVQKIINEEINNQLKDAERRFYRDEASVFLWVLHEVCGFGPVRLKRVYFRYEEEADKLRDHYEMSDSDMPYLTREMLKKHGVDLDEWEREIEEREAKRNGCQ